LSESRFTRLARLGALTGRVAGRSLKEKTKGIIKKRAEGKPSREILNSATAEDITATLGKLKGAAMKAGQQLAMVASHMDLPPEIQRKLERLHSKAEPIPFNTIKSTVESELGGTIQEHFLSFDIHPIGTASLAQAHAARLHDGTDVVVKVMHDGVAESLETDLLTLKGVMLGGRMLGRSSDELHDVFEEVAKHLRQELDYLQEAVNIHTFSQVHAGDERFRIPALHPDWCTQRILTMDRLTGVDFRTFLLTADESSRQRAGVSLAEWFFEGTFRHRLLHADPHPGNFLFEPDGRMGVVDFGCVKRFNEFFVAQYAKLVLHAFDEDHDALLAGCVEMGLWDGSRKEAGEAIIQFCETVVQPWRDGPSVLGSGDDLVQRVKPAAKAVWKYPEIRGAKDMVMLHRTLGGLYSFAKEFRAEGDWGALMKTHLHHAIDVAEGRIPR
jgi:predicted unusual protein kinase regulating ubiquinone biosynthesis (AarF/ABC1/UbiB family)